MGGTLTGKSAAAIDGLGDDRAGGRVLYLFLSTQASTASLGSFGPSAEASLFDQNGFDFGLSAPKTGAGYGLLGDVSAPKSGCANCAPKALCPSCDDASDGAANADGQIIKTQVPIPAPGLFPPPIVTTPSQPSRPPIIGDPNAFWNRPLGDLWSWASRPSEEQREKCQDEYDTDMIDCKTVWAVKGARQGSACQERAWDKLIDCLHNDGKKGIQPYWRQGS